MVPAHYYYANINFFNASLPKTSFKKASLATTGYCGSQIDFSYTDLRRQLRGLGRSRRRATSPA